MNEDTFKGQWMQLKGKIREQWGKLTDDDVDQIQGRSEQLIGKLQNRYGIARDEAQRQVDAWMQNTRVEPTTVPLTRTEKCSDGPHAGPSERGQHALHIGSPRHISTQPRAPAYPSGCARSSPPAARCPCRRWPRSRRRRQSPRR